MLESSFMFALGKGPTIALSVHPIGRRFLSIGLLSTVALGVLAGAAWGQPERSRLIVRQDGVYRLPFESLEPTARWSVDADWVSVWWRDQPVNAWIDDGGDGFFGPGDALEFIGEHLAGEDSYFDASTRDNIYWVRLDRPRIASMYEVPGSSAGQPEVVARFRHHLENDEQRVRFSGRGEETIPDEWYWEKMTPIDRKPVALPLDLRQWRRDAGPLSLSLAFKGWSKPRRRVEGDPRDHRVEVWFADELMGAGEWDGEETFVLELPAIETSELTAEQPVLQLRVPRRVGAEGEDWIDAILFDWAEVSFPMDPQVSTVYRLELPENAVGRVTVEGGGGHSVVAYGSSGTRQTLAADQGRGGLRDIHANGEDAWIYAVREDRYLAPEAVAVDRASDLRGADRQVDYLMISHQRLVSALEPLAAFHRSRGLTVEIVDVQDIYDEFNGGILSPQAIRDFIADAFHHRPAPAPRFVLLAGDASWDPRGGEAADDRDYADWTFQGRELRWFMKNGSTSYADTSGDRNLVPARPYQSYEGHAAADNWYVSVDGDDFQPDLAIGRFPVTTPEEVQAIVDKTIRYVESSTVGPWKRQVLWITNEQRGMQNNSDNLASQMRDRGYTELKVYPSPDEKDNSQHQERLKEAFSSGNLFVHFLGHGGRYIWRTGPPDLSKNHDLFTLDDLDDLEPTDNLPIILSMTCYSAPFDHPTADSIGEKFLRLAHRGAVGVLAASWRNSPGRRFSEALLAELSQPGATLGEAVQRAKNEINSRVLVETYNLLGDPAVPVAIPSVPLDLEWVEVAEGHELLLNAGELEGQVLVEWLDAEGEVLAERRAALAEEPLRLKLSAEELESVTDARWIRAYAWDEATRRDGLTALDLTVKEDAAVVEVAASSANARRQMLEDPAERPENAGNSEEAEKAEKAEKNQATGQTAAQNVGGSQR
ncbi:MAG: hypothetical protein K8J08_18180 [Thermoanaerobaculia bacterium]|nr:hypothetical protein [Thermoanaerobaculia bacterium]